MKSSTIRTNKGIFNKRILNEDMRLLQKMTSGSSVYKNAKAVYVRKPKHHKTIFSY